MLSALSVVLNKECRLNPSRAILVGFSGGPDSLMLIHAMHALGYPLIAAHLDHGLRPASDGESIVLQHMLSGWNIPFISCHRDVKAYAAERGLSIEEAGRVLRYEFLFELAGLHQTQAVAVGHQADDQVETVLMHMLRGSGLAGLCGMPYRALPNPWSTTIPLIRPLLNTWREDILAYCAENDLHPLEDQSNRDITYFRNRLRHQLIPFLAENYNPNIRRIFQHMADNLAQDYEIVKSIVEQAWRQCLKKQGDGFTGFEFDAWTAQPAAVQRHLLRKAMLSLLPDLRDIDYETIKRALEFTREIAEHPPAKPEKQIELIGGLRLIYETRKRSLWIVNPSPVDVSAEALLRRLSCGEYPQLSGRDEIVLDVPGAVDLADWVCEAVWVDGEHAQNDAEANENPWQAWFDLSRLDSQVTRLTLRSRLPGERFQPLGLDGKSAKITEMMIDLKIPRAMRLRYPILAADGRAIWLPGYRTAQCVRIEPSTRRALYVRFRSPRTPLP